MRNWEDPTPAVEKWQPPAAIWGELVRGCAAASVVVETVDRHVAEGAQPAGARQRSVEGNAFVDPGRAGLEGYAFVGERRMEVGAPRCKRRAVEPTDRDQPILGRVVHQQLDASADPPRYLATIQSGDLRGAGRQEDVIAHVFDRLHDGGARDGRREQHGDGKRGNRPRNVHGTLHGLAARSVRVPVYRGACRTAAGAS